MSWLPINFLVRIVLGILALAFPFLGLYTLCLAEMKFSLAQFAFIGLSNSIVIFSILLIFLSLLHLSIFIAASAFFVFLSAKLKQLRVDQLSKNIVAKVLRGNKTKRYFLYFRPFSSDGTLIANSMTFKENQSFLGVGWNILDEHFEMQMRNSLGLYGALVCLGENGKHMGAGRYETKEENWQEDVMKLAQAACGIICIPSTGQGSMWEIVLILQNEGLIRKTLFLLPRSTNAGAHEFTNFVNGLRKEMFFVEGIVPNESWFTLRKTGVRNFAVYEYGELSMAQVGEFGNYLVQMELSMRLSSRSL